MDFFKIIQLLVVQFKGEPSFHADTEMVKIQLCYLIQIKMYNLKTKRKKIALQFSFCFNVVIYLNYNFDYKKKCAYIFTTYTYVL